MSRGEGDAADVAAEAPVGVAGGRAPAEKGKAEDEDDSDEGVDGSRREEEKLKEGTGAGVGTALLEAADDGARAGAGVDAVDGDEGGCQMKGRMVEPRKPVRLLSQLLLCPSPSAFSCSAPLTAAVGCCCCCLLASSRSCSTSLLLLRASLTVSVRPLARPLGRGRARL